MIQISLTKFKSLLLYIKYVFHAAKLAKLICIEIILN